MVIFERIRETIGETIEDIGEEIGIVEPEEDAEVAEPITVGPEATPEDVVSEVEEKVEVEDGEVELKKPEDEITTEKDRKEEEEVTQTFGGGGGSVEVEKRGGFEEVKVEDVEKIDKKEKEETVKIRDTEVSRERFERDFERSLEQNLTKKEISKLSKRDKERLRERFKAEYIPPPDIGESALAFQRELPRQPEESRIEFQERVGESEIERARERVVGEREVALQNIEEIKSYVDLGGGVRTDEGDIIYGREAREYLEEREKEIKGASEKQLKEIGKEERQLQKQVGLLKEVEAGRESIEKRRELLESPEAETLRFEGFRKELGDLFGEVQEGDVTGIGEEIFEVGRGIQIRGAELGGIVEQEILEAGEDYEKPTLLPTEDVATLAGGAGTFITQRLGLGVSGAGAGIVKVEEEGLEETIFDIPEDLVSGLGLFKEEFLKDPKEFVLQESGEEIGEIATGAAIGGPIGAALAAGGFTIEPEIEVETVLEVDGKTLRELSIGTGEVRRATEEQLRELPGAGKTPFEAPFDTGIETEQPVIFRRDVIFQEDGLIGEVEVEEGKAFVEGERPIEEFGFEEDIFEEPETFREEEIEVLTRKRQRDIESGREEIFRPLGGGVTEAEFRRFKELEGRRKAARERLEERLTRTRKGELTVTRGRRRFETPEVRQSIEDIKTVFGPETEIEFEPEPIRGEPLRRTGARVREIETEVEAERNILENLGLAPKIETGVGEGIIQEERIRPIEELGFFEGEIEIPEFEFGAPEIETEIGFGAEIEPEPELTPEFVFEPEAEIEPEPTIEFLPDEDEEEERIIENVFEGGDREQRFVQSLSAEFFGITAEEAPEGALTGVEIRPVISGSNDKKNSKSNSEKELEKAFGL